VLLAVRLVLLGWSCSSRGVVPRGRRVRRGTTSLAVTHPGGFRPLWPKAVSSPLRPGL